LRHILDLCVVANIPRHELGYAPLILQYQQVKRPRVALFRALNQFIVTITERHSTSSHLTDLASFACAQSGSLI